MTGTTSSTHWIAPADAVPGGRAPGRRGLAVVLAVAAAILPGAEPPASAAKGDDFITAQTSGILDIEGGDCFSDPFHHRGADEVVVRYTPCYEPPVDNQAYGFLHADDGPWDRAALAEFAWTGCERGFARQWGGRDGSSPRARSPQPRLDFYPILPTAETWADGDRDVMCVVYNRDGRLAGSAVPLAR